MTNSKRNDNCGDRNLQEKLICDGFKSMSNRNIFSQILKILTTNRKICNVITYSVNQDSLFAKTKIIDILHGN